jgi:Ca2+-binding EF-hand superfamily protein
MTLVCLRCCRLGSWHGWIAVVVVGVGCSNRPAAVKPVSVDAAEAGQAAISLYDRNSDSKLEASELTNVPGVLRYLGLYDTDKDGKVSADEFAARFKKWEQDQLGMRELVAIVTLDGKPLVGATVRFIPEPYLGPNVKPATGETDDQGIAMIAMSDEDTPERFRATSVRGVTGGTYKVEVTHPEKKLPAKFNTETTLGEEVAVDTIRSSAFVQLKSQ